MTADRQTPPEGRLLIRWKNQVYAAIRYDERGWRVRESRGMVRPGEPGNYSSRELLDGDQLYLRNFSVGIRNAGIPSGQFEQPLGEDVEVELSYRLKALVTLRSEGGVWSLEDHGVVPGGVRVGRKPRTAGRLRLGETLQVTRDLSVKLVPAAQPNPALSELPSELPAPIRIGAQAGAPGKAQAVPFDEEADPEEATLSEAKGSESKGSPTIEELLPEEPAGVRKAVPEAAAPVDPPQADKVDRRALKITAIAASLLLVVASSVGLMAFHSRPVETVITPEQACERARSRGLRYFCKEDYAKALSAFSEALRVIPGDVPSQLLREITRSFSEGSNAFSLDWEGLAALFEKLHDSASSGEELKAFAAEQAEWARREARCAEKVSQLITLKESGDVEGTMALFREASREFPKSDLLPLVSSEIAELRNSLRQKYWQEAAAAIAEPNWSFALGALRKVEENSALDDSELSERVQYCEFNRDFLSRVKTISEHVKKGKLEEARQRLEDLPKGPVHATYQKGVDELSGIVTRRLALADARSHYGKGRVHRALQVVEDYRDPDAEKFRQKVSRVVDDLKEARNLELQGRQVEALRLAGSVIELENDPDNFYHLEARQQQARLRQKVDASREEHYRRAREDYEASRFEKALRSFEQALELDLENLLRPAFQAWAETEATRVCPGIKFLQMQGRKLVETQRAQVKLFAALLPENSPARKDVEQILLRDQPKDAHRPSGDSRSPANAKSLPEEAKVNRRVQAENDRLRKREEPKQQAPQGNDQDAQKPVRVSFPGRSWALELVPRGVGELALERQSQDEVFAKGENGQKGLFLSVLLYKAPAPGDARVARGAWVRVLKQRYGFPVQELKLFERGPMAVAEVRNRDLGGPPVENLRHLMAFLVRDGTWMNVRISKQNFTPEDERLFEDILHSVKFVRTR